MRLSKPRAGTNDPACSLKTGPNYGIVARSGP
jgi:hypothetical protein